MKKLLVILLFVFCLLASKGHTQDRWVYVGSTTEAEFYYDNETIKHNNGEVTVYTKSVYKTSKYDPLVEKYIDYSIDRMIYYCNDYRYKLLSAIKYYTDETHINLDFSKHSQSSLLIPETMAETMFKAVCK